MKFIFIVIFLILFCSCTATYVRYSDLSHVQNVQRIKMISKTRLKYELLEHFSPKVLRDTIMNYELCDRLLKGKSVKDTNTCLYYFENRNVIKYRGSYYVRSSAFVNYISQEKFRKYINKDLKF